MEATRGGELRFIIPRDTALVYRASTGPWEVSVAGDERDLHVEVRSATVGQLAESLRWLRQTVHQAHHEGPVESCARSVCDHVARTLEREGLT